MIEPIEPTPFPHGLPVSLLAERAGIEIHRGHLPACPVCHQSGHGSGKLYRPPSGAERVHCFRCEADLSALDLARILWPPGSLPSDIDPVLYRSARATPDPPTYPPADALSRLWESGHAVGTDRDAVAFLTGSRELDLDAVERVGVLRALPAAPSDWDGWPWERSQRTAGLYRLAARAFDAQGRFRSIHARAVREPPERAGKTRWPKGYTSRGLFMANRLGLALLRGRPGPALRALLLVEGLTDFVAASVAAERRPWAVIGGTAGSFSALAEVRVPEHVRINIATDHDDAGDRYADEIRAALGGRAVARLEW